MDLQTNQMEGHLGQRGTMHFKHVNLMEIMESWGAVPDKGDRQETHVQGVMLHIAGEIMKVE